MDKSRIFKIIVGAGIILAGFLFNASWWIIVVFPLFAGVINRCHSFFPFGQSSCKIEKPKKIKAQKNNF